MDTQYVIDALFGALLFMLTYWFNTVNKDVERLTDKVDNVEKLVLGDYIKKDEFVRVSNQLLYKMDAVYDKLDRKVDK